MFANLRGKNITKDEFASKFSIALAIIFLLSFLLAFFYVPLIRIFYYSFSTETGNLGEIFRETLTSRANLLAIGFSFVQALASTVICLIFGLPAGYLLAKYDFKGKKLLINLLTVPFVLPPIVVLSGFIVTYGDSGWINLLWKSVTNSSFSIISIFGTIEGILLAHVFYNISVIIRLTIPAWQSVDYAQVEVSETLGASKFKIFRKIISPQVINSVVAASLLVFVYTFNSFAIVLKLAEAKFSTLEVQIYQEVTTYNNYTGASILLKMEKK